VKAGNRRRRERRLEAEAQEARGAAEWARPEHHAAVEPVEPAAAPGGLLHRRLTAAEQARQPGSALGRAVDEHGNVRAGWVVPGANPATSTSAAGAPGPVHDPWDDYGDDGVDHRPLFLRLREDGHAGSGPPPV
jgi:hypothetical protein